VQSDNLPEKKIDDSPRPTHVHPKSGHSQSNKSNQVLLSGLDDSSLGEILKEVKDLSVGSTNVNQAIGLDGRESNTVNGGYGNGQDNISKYIDPGANRLNEKGVESMDSTNFNPKHKSSFSKNDFSLIFDPSEGGEEYDPTGSLINPNSGSQLQENPNHEDAESILDGARFQNISGDNDIQYDSGHRIQIESDSKLKNLNRPGPTDEMQNSHNSILKAPAGSSPFYEESPLRSNSSEDPVDAQFSYDSRLNRSGAQSELQPTTFSSKLNANSSKLNAEQDARFDQPEPSIMEADRAQRTKLLNEIHEGHQTEVDKEMGSLKKFIDNHRAATRQGAFGLSSDRSQIGEKIIGGQRRPLSIDDIEEKNSDFKPSERLEVNKHFYSTNHQSQLGTKSIPTNPRIADEVSGYASKSGLFRHSFVAKKSIASQPKYENRSVNPGDDENSLIGHVFNPNGTFHSDSPKSDNYNSLLPHQKLPGSNYMVPTFDLTNAENGEMSQSHPSVGKSIVHGLTDSQMEDISKIEQFAVHPSRIGRMTADLGSNHKTVKKYIGGSPQTGALIVNDHLFDGVQSVTNKDSMTQNARLRPKTYKSLAKPATSRAMNNQSQSPRSLYSRRRPEYHVNKGIVHSKIYQPSSIATTKWNTGPRNHQGPTFQLVL
jgi:hypothetical protein